MMREKKPVAFLGIGVAIGAGLGVAFGNIAAGIGAGIAIGALMTVVRSRNSMDDD